MSPSSNYGRFAEANLEHINPFDFVDGYFPYESALTWKPGEAIPGTSLLLQYYRDTVGAPSCLDSASGIIRPYTVHSYEGSPLRRETMTKFPGNFASHPLQINYGRSDVPIPGRSAVAFAPDSVSRVMTTDENGNCRALYFDKFGRKILERTNFRNTADSNPTYTRHYPDSDGNDTLIVQPAGQQISRKFNSLGWLSDELHPDRGHSSIIYDLMGRQRFVKSAADSAASRFVYTKYDPHGREIEQGVVNNVQSFTLARASQSDFPNPELDSAYAVTENQWDVGTFGRGRLRQSHSFAVGRPLDISYDVYTYDERGRVTRKTQSVYPVDRLIDQKHFDFSYDNANTVRQITYPDQSSINYLYDRFGRITEIRDGAEGQVVRARFDYWPGGQLRQSRLGAMTQPAQTVDYRYNARGWIVDINDPESVSAVDSTNADHFALRLNYETGALGSPSGYFNGNVASYTAKISPGDASLNTVQRFAYDGADRISQEQFAAGSPQPPTLTYSYDKNGNITRLHPQSGNDLIYRYENGTNRVVDVTNLYPGTGNLRYTPVGGLSEIAYYGMRMSYDPLERMSERSRGRIGLTRDTVTYWYSPDGWRTAKLHKYWEEYNCSDTLIPIEDGRFEPESIWPKPTRGLGFLMATSGPPGQTCVRQKSYVNSYYYDLEHNILSEYGGDPTGMPGAGALVGNYVYLGGKRIARCGGSTGVEYYLTDHLGSVLATVDNTGQVKSKELFRSFGKSLVNRTGPTDAFQYTGKERDRELSSDWDYFGARWYVPELRQFVQVDPAWDLYPWLGTYQYVANNPVKYIDKDGAVAPLAIYEAIETAMDVKALGESIAEFRADPSLGNGVMVGLYGVSTILPIISLGLIKYGFDGIDDGADAARLAKTTQKIEDAADARQAQGSGRAVEQSMGNAAIPRVHGNSFRSPSPTTVYDLQHHQTGFHYKFGITSAKPIEARYKREFLLDKKMVSLTTGSRADMYKLERKMVREKPGPLNREPWAGKKEKP